ncbi:MvdC/MvdD family ATP grasp protein [Nocardia rhizosphaerae]|uniref:MvdC/MvdD family ATP grasp protein n=1 Tax=Nocardia rhizosphaerae TaxID=1691571 RepID=A0ABV8LDL6_9NOCA
MERATDAVLIVSESDDLHADALAATLREHHRLDPIRLDLRDFPAQTGSFRLDKAGTNRALAHLHGLDDVRAVWWRRPHPCRVPQGMRADDDAFRQAECDGFLQGMLWSIPAYWVNDPAAERTASRKIVQLETAQRAGFTIPETLITNDPDEARSFVESRSGPVVYKRTGTGRGEFSETRIITRPELSRLATIRSTPTTFQDYIEAGCDLRVVWVDGIEWAVRIDSRAGVGRVDSRLDTSVAFTRDRLPASVSKSLATLMGALGLSFGVVDLRLGTDGEYYFLEVNPQGQFAYLEIKTGLPLFTSLAHLLVHGDGSVPGW